MNTFTPTRHLLGATAVGILLAATACAGPAQSTSAASTPASEKATPTTSPSPTKQVSATGLPIKGLANDGRGEYLQTTITDDDPAMTLDPSIVEENATSRFSMDEIASAQKFIIKFIAEEGIDSTLNGNPNDPATIDAWWAKNKDKMDPSKQDVLLAGARSEDVNQNFVFRPRFREGQYGLAYGPTRTHIVNRTIKPKAIRGGEMDGKTVIGLQSDLSFSVAALRDGKDALENVDAVMSYTVSKDAKTGSWQIYGNNARFDVAPAS